jgi:type I restriction enzyme R subunit
LADGRTKAQGAERDERGGIVWHTQGSGKSLSMVFLVRKMRMMPRLNRFKVVVVTDRTDLEDQLATTAQLSGEAVRPTDADLQSRESPTALTQRLLSERTPDIVMAMLQKYQPVGGKSDAKTLSVLPQPGEKAGDKVAMTILRREKKPGRREEIVEKTVTFTENIRFEEFPELNTSEEILVLVDEAHRSHTRTLNRNLRNLG